MGLDEVSMLPVSGDSTHTVLPLMVHSPLEVETMLGPGAVAELLLGANAPLPVSGSGDANSWEEN